VTDILPPSPTCREYQGASRGYCPQPASKIGALGRGFCTQHAELREKYAIAQERGN
jgi:hypothetical protein